ncbi:MAG: hypothetical protein IH588_05720 [Anaerolineales bacterium]|nr:hypothetical protein [Anaerolineales bacterium]
MPRAIIEPVIVQSEPDTILNFASALPDNKGGRPVAMVNPETAAAYFYQFPKMPSYREAESMGITRTQHGLTVDFMIKFVKVYSQLLETGLEGYAK